MKVKDFKKFQLFKYTDLGQNYQIQNGHILIKDNEIGVVIQEFGNEEFRTDMWGNSYPSEVRFATIEQIEKYRPKILLEL